MHCTNDKRHVPRRQRGFTLLLTMLVLLVGGASVYLSARNPAEARLAQSLQKSSVDLHDAATALAVYSIGSNDRPGSMPCPDENSDGSTPLLSGDDCPTYVGRLPWKTIDTDRQASRLWYVLDSDFRDDDSAEPINVALAGSLTINGVSGFAALIIDPGDPLEGQDGRPSNDVTHYLEGENADGDDVFQDCSGSDTCNDRIIGISVDQLMAVVQQRVLAEVESKLRQYHADNGYLPYAAEFSGGSSCDQGQREGRIATSEGDCYFQPYLSGFESWIVANEWLDHIVYSVDLECTQGQSGCGESSHVLKSRTGLAVVLAGAGTLHDGQQRESGTRTVDDYLDSAENTNSDGVFDDATLSSTDNDVLRGFALPTDPAGG